MLKKFSKLSIAFVALFCFSLEKIQAYEFINQENEKSVTQRINSIYESKELYDAIFGLDDSSKLLNFMTSNEYWWPIGSVETVTIGGVLFAPGEPQTVSTSDGFGCYPWRADKEKGEICGWHNGLDISGLGLPPGSINVVAVKDGVVVYPKEPYQTQYKDHTGSAYRNGDGDGLGNYVVIQHSDGTRSVYGHLAYNSITVMEKKSVRQGQIIGKVGHTGSSTAAHLHFGIKVNGKYVDPMDYIDPTNTRPQDNTTSFSLISTSLTKGEFVTKMNNYCIRSKNDGFCNNFANQADKIYDISTKNYINPELVVAVAGAENDWSLDSTCAYTNNYWGIGLVDGAACNSGGVYSSLSEAITAYAQELAKYKIGGTYSNAITQINNERKEAVCSNVGYGLPGTLEGMEAIRFPLGEYRYNPGTTEKPGCNVLNGIYASDYCSNVTLCTDYDACPVESKTTVCEQNDYTAWLVNKKAKIRYDIFGL